VRFIYTIYFKLGVLQFSKVLDAYTWVCVYAHIYLHDKFQIGRALGLKKKELQLPRTHYAPSLKLWFWRFIPNHTRENGCMCVGVSACGCMYTQHISNWKRAGSEIAAITHDSLHPVADTTALYLHMHVCMCLYVRVCEYIYIYTIYFKLGALRFSNGSTASGFTTPNCCNSRFLPTHTHMCVCAHIHIYTIYSRLGALWFTHSFHCQGFTTPHCWPQLCGLHIHVCMCECVYIHSYNSFKLGALGVTKSCNYPAFTAPHRRNHLFYINIYIHVRVCVLVCVCIYFK